jgi:MoaA/NifB/PqqE/SkfB family radical SAM enzyme
MKITHYIGNMAKFFNRHSSGLIFYVTNRCNAACKHCFYSQNLNKRSDILTLPEIEKMAQKIGKRENIVLTGGEPFLRQDLPEIARILVVAGTKRIIINTNGIECRNIIKSVEEISKIHGIELKVNVSIDGVGENHNKIRGIEGAFDSATRTVKLLKEKDIKTGVLTNINYSNYKSTGDIYDFCENELGIKPGLEIIRGTGVCGLPGRIKNMGYRPRERNVMIGREEVSAVRQSLKDTFRYMISKSRKKTLSYCRTLARLDSVLDIVERKEHIFNCNAGQEQAVIYENGDMALCEMAVPVGNLRDYDFDMEKILYSEKSRRQRDFIKKCYCTHSCHVNIVYSPYYMRKFIKTFFQQLSDLRG